jgi:hypothetical protein
MGVSERVFPEMSVLWVIELMVRPALNLGSTIQQA